MIANVYASSTPTWPSPWIQIDWDKNENGPQDDWRDVEYAYYNFDSDYLYLRLECYANPGSQWPSGGARYKWFIDLDGNLYVSGGNVIEAEYLLFVEDTDNNGQGELYLLYDITGDGKFDEYGPWPPANYNDYKITNAADGGWKIDGRSIDMYINWSMLGDPSSYWLYWVTDNENPNLNQAPTTDSRDEETAIHIRDVAAVSQTVNATSVVQGEIVQINVTVQNLGMQVESFNVTCYFYPTIVGTQRVTDLAAGQNITLTFYWNTSEVEPGTYSIRALADSGGEILENNETNNWCTADATVTVTPAPKHDLAAITQVANVTMVEQGGWVQINVTVENMGDFTESFNVTCYYDSNNVIETKRVAKLEAGQSTTLIFYWNTATVDPGIYFITAIVDSEHEIAESDETNNNCTTTLPITVYAPPLPGILSVDKVLVRVVDGPDPAIVNYATTYEIMIVVANIGGSNVTDIQVNDTIYSGVTYSGIGEPSKGSAYYDGSKIIWDVGVLEPGENAILTFNVTLTPSSSDTFTLNRGGDLIARGINATGGQVEDYGDLDVEVSAYTRDVRAVSQTPLKNVVVQGETVGIDVQVENGGDYYSETYNVTCYYSSDQVNWIPIMPIDTLRLYNQAPGNITTLRFAWNTTGVLPGTYYIRAMADSDLEIPESDETNNNCTSTSIIVKIVIHDIAAISQVPNPTEVFQGGIVTINVKVANEGTETENFTLRVYYYGERECCASVEVENLSPGESRTLTFTWNTTGIPPGTYWISAHALPVEGELDTDDNACTSMTAVIVKAAPVGGIIVQIESPATIFPVSLTALALTLAFIAITAAGVIITLKKRSTYVKL
jgi:subtilase family serine protease